ncbi:MAG: hypothetical protein K9H61_12140 [Bacteroidia bacterium]|nr:hypothetical protein [Bacteroidia bacterium]MCF8427846.1 hypothetical protein [Bacteroidia bacterium]MCF8447737.1 hypothetical protein [Bacteroidia bacterium]
MKKLLGNGKPLLLLTIILGLSFSSCTKDWWGHEGGNGHGGGNNEPAVLKGTVVYQACGLSIYGNRLWIQLDNGTLLQPCAQSFESLVPIELHQGERVELRYSNYTGDYNSFEIYCKMAYFPFTRATIDYIKVLDNGNCLNIEVKSDYENHSAAMVNILDAQQEGMLLNIKFGFSGCSNSAKDRFQVIAKPLTTKPNEITYEIKFIDKREELCQAYFTSNQCLDISKLKKSKDEIITIKLVGYNTSFRF